MPSPILLACALMYAVGLVWLAGKVFFA